MLSAVPDMLPAMKRLIDDGYALRFAEAMAFEREWSQAHRAPGTGEAVAGRGARPPLQRGAVIAATKFAAESSATRNHWACSTRNLSQCSWMRLKRGFCAPISA
jgi:hypothetical protein